MISCCKKCKSRAIAVDETYPYHNIHECRDCKHLGHTPIDDCCRNPFLIVTVKHYSIDQSMLYHQCLNCGGSTKTKPLKKTDYSEQIEGEFDQTLFGRWKTDKSAESNLIYSSLKLANYKNTRAYQYHSYLRSEKWMAKRTFILIRDNYLCQSCKLHPALDVHHLTYENIYDEPLEDLQALCRACHLKVHLADYCIR